MVSNVKSIKTRDPRRALWEAAGRRLYRGRVFATPHCHDLCLTPEHQRYISRARAMLEASQRGKLSCGAKHAAAVAAGRRRGAKLNWQIVEAMRKRYAETGNSALVAREFGVQQQHAHRVVTHVVWRATTPWSV